MIKGSTKARTYRAIYRLLNRVSPVDFDCGILCGASCCTAERTTAQTSAQETEQTTEHESLEEESTKAESEMGIYLLPGEDKIHDKKDPWLSWSEDSTDDYDFPKSWDGKVFFVRCEGPSKCKREMRPMQCRTFPLAPHIDEEGNLTVVYNDMELPYRCPLIDDEMPLNDSFVQATKTVWKHLIRDPLIYDMVKEDSDARMEAFRELYEKMFY